MWERAKRIQVAENLGVFIRIGMFIVIFFVFAVGIVMERKLFQGANTLEKKTGDINEACTLAETMASKIKEGSSVEDTLKELKVNQVQDNYTTAVYESFYNSEWKQVIRKDKYRTIMTVEKQPAGDHTMYVIDIVIKSEHAYPVIKKEEGHVLTTLHVCSYK